MDRGSEFSAKASADGVGAGGCDGVLEKAARSLALFRFDSLVFTVVEKSNQTSAGFFSGAMAVLNFPGGDLAATLFAGLVGGQPCSPAEALALADFTALSAAMLDGSAGADLDTPLSQQLVNAALPKPNIIKPDYKPDFMPVVSPPPVPTEAPRGNRRPSMVRMIHDLELTNLSAAELEMVQAGLDAMGFDTSASLKSKSAQIMITLPKLEVGHQCNYVYSLLLFCALSPLLAR